MKKIPITDPARKIERADIDTLINSVNQFIEEFDTEKKQIQRDFEFIHDSRIELERKANEFNTKLESFLSRQVELFGIFIAIFSFILAGIQFAGNAPINAGFWDKLANGFSIFIPITVCIVILLSLIRFIIRK